MLERQLHIGFKQFWEMCLNLFSVYNITLGGGVRF